jgi:hypothetical protein
VGQCKLRLEPRLRRASGGAYDDFAHVDVLRLFERKCDGAGDRICADGDSAEGLHRLRHHRITDMVRQLRRRRAWADDRDANITIQLLLA